MSSGSYYSSSAGSSSSGTGYNIEVLEALASDFTLPNLDKMTVFLDLDNTSIFYCKNYTGDYDFEIEIGGEILHIKKRPYLDEILKFLSENFDVYIYTAAKYEYGKKIFDKLNQPKPMIKGIYTFEDCIHGSFPIKDLEIRRTPLSRTFLIDDNKDAFRKHPKNGLLVPPYNGEKDDNGLYDCLIKLKNIINCINVQDALSSDVLKRRLTY